MAKLSKDQVVTELWKRGSLKWLLHEGQVKIYDKIKESTDKLFVGNCSRQWGKSYEMGVICVETALNIPKAQIRYGAAHRTDVTAYIIPTFDKILETCPESLRPKFLENKNTYVFANGAEIRIVGVDKNPNGLRGNTLDLVVLDECAFMKNLDYVYNSVIIPATTHRPNAKIILISTPPVSPAHSFKKFCAKAELTQSYCKFTIYDNPMLTEQKIDFLAASVGGKESTTWKREYLCEFVVDSFLAIIPEWTDSYVVVPNRDGVWPYGPKDGIYNLWHKYVGMDMGVVDLTVLLFAHYNFSEACIYIEDEIWLNGPDMTTDKIAKLSREKEIELWGPKKPYRRIADNNNLVMINDLSIIHDMSFVPTDKEALEAMVNEVRLWVMKGRVKVAERCLQLLGCVRYGVWDERRKKFDRSDDYGHFDALAALVYLIRNIDTSTNPIPYDYGKTGEDIFKLKRPHLSDNAQILKQAFSTRKPNG